MSFDAAVWLARGDPALPTKLQAWLLASHGSGNWDENDIPAADVVLSKSKADLWRDILDDAAKDAKETAGKVQHRRLQVWLNPIKTDEDEGINKVYVPTVQCKDDMLAQGATSYLDLVFSELSLVSGRPASKAELEGGMYAGPASLTVGGKLLIKAECF